VIGEKTDYVCWKGFQKVLPDIAEELKLGKRIKINYVEEEI
jgi:hypothetical protein